MKRVQLATIFIAAYGLSTLALAGSVSVLVLDKEGKPVADAVVVVQPAAKAATARALPMQATILQEKMRFVPAVTVVPLGAKVRFENADPWDHHVRASAAGAAQFAAAGNTSGGFELRLEGKPDNKPAKFAEVTLDKPGVLGASLLGCFLHGSMRGHIYVSDSPWAAKTGADGMAQFDDVPDGAAQVKVWQADQLIDLQPQQATVSATPLKLRAQLQVVPRRPRAAPTSGGYSG